jgi:hypothetical protein
MASGRRWSRAACICIFKLYQVMIETVYDKDFQLRPRPGTMGCTLYIANRLSNSSASMFTRPPVYVHCRPQPVLVTQYMGPPVGGPAAYNAAADAANNWMTFW